MQKIDYPMRTHRNKSRGILIGVLIGFSISFLLLLVVSGSQGLGFFPALDRYVKKVSGYFSSSGDVPQSTDLQKGLVEIRLLKERNDVPTAEAWLGDTASYEPEDALDELMGMAADSAARDSLMRLLESGKGNMSDLSLIKRDQMTNFRMITVRNADLKKEKQEAIADSTLVESSNPKKPGLIRVEFWQSPLNYKGYKANRNKIVLFGIDADEQVSIVRMKNALYLIHAGSCFLLDETEEFRTYIRVTDPLLIKQLISG